MRFSADKEFKSSGTSVVDVHVKYFVSLFAFCGPIYVISRLPILPYILPVLFSTALCCPGVNMFEAYRQKCSAEDLSRLKVALCSGEDLFSKVIIVF